MKIIGLVLCLFLLVGLGLFYINSSKTTSSDLSLIIPASDITTTATTITEISIDAPATATPDSDFMATVNIDEVVGMNAAQYDIVFDPNVLRLDDVTAGQIGTTVVGVMHNQISPGTVRVLQSMGLKTVSGSGTLANLHFHVIGPTERTDISLSNGLLAGFNGEIPSTWCHIFLKIIYT